MNARPAARPSAGLRARGHGAREGVGVVEDHVPFVGTHQVGVAAESTDDRFGRVHAVLGCCRWGHSMRQARCAALQDLRKLR